MPPTAYSYFFKRHAVKFVAFTGCEAVLVMLIKSTRAPVALIL